MRSKNSAQFVLVFSALCVPPSRGIDDVSFRHSIPLQLKLKKGTNLKKLCSICVFLVTEFTNMVTSSGRSKGNVRFPLVLFSHLKYVSPSKLENCTQWVLFCTAILLT